MVRRPLRASWWAFAVSPLAAILFTASPAPAGPPGPWVFIPPPGGTTTTATTGTTTAATGVTTTPNGSAPSAVTPVPLEEGDRRPRAQQETDRARRPARGQAVHPDGALAHRRGHGRRRRAVPRDELHHQGAHGPRGRGVGPRHPRPAIGRGAARCEGV